MRIRVARKIYNAVGGPDEARYRQSSLRTGIDRVCGTRSAKATRRYVLPLLKRAIDAGLFREAQRR